MFLLVEILGHLILLLTPSLQYRPLIYTDFSCMLAHLTSFICTVPAATGPVKVFWELFPHVVTVNDTMAVFIVIRESVVVRF